MNWSKVISARCFTPTTRRGVSFALISCRDRHLLRLSVSQLLDTPVWHQHNGVLFVPFFPAQRPSQVRTLKNKGSRKQHFFVFFNLQSLVAGSLKIQTISRALSWGGERAQVRVNEPRPLARPLSISVPECTQIHLHAPSFG